MAVVRLGLRTNPPDPADDEKAIQADAAYTAAINLLNEKSFASKLSSEARAALKKSADQLFYDLAVYRGELSKQARRGGGGVPVVLATTMTQTQTSAGTPFAVLVGIAMFAGAALGAVAAAISNSGVTARNALDSSLKDLAGQSTTAIGTVPRPFTASPVIPRPFFDELVRLGILIVEASIISIDFSSFRKKVVEMMKGVEDLFKKNQNPCDDRYMIVRSLALQFFELLNKLPANDNDGGQAIIRLTNIAVQWMRAVNDLFNCFELPTPFPKA